MARCTWQQDWTMNKLTKLSIERFRNVAPTTLEFRPGLNVLLGKNAAGKTTLLRLLSSAIGKLGPAHQDDAFKLSYRVSGESLDYEHTITRERLAEPNIALESLGGGLPNLHQSDSFVFEKNGERVAKTEVRSNEIMLEFKGQQRRVEREGRGLPPLISTVVSLALASNLDSSVRGLEGAILDARVESAGRMDESLEQFAALLKHEVRREGETFRGNLAEMPTSMRQDLLQGPMPQGTSAMFVPEFLGRVVRVLGYDSASARFDVEHIALEDGRQAARLSNLRFFFKRPGEEVSHELLSYGQKRLLAFFAHADASRDVIIADELVNGLHHEWIKACLEEIGDRQAFLTSQNPLLLDFLRFDSAEEVRRTFILCERTTGALGAQLIWRNPTEEEAESFFAAYQTGIQRVSDILLTKGFW
jgi:energy-coupling factor transporter ATP-binding protein EcfA2